MKCYGDPASIVASAYGGYPPYIYSWGLLTNGSYTLTPKPLPTTIFSDDFSNDFEVQGGLLNQSILCEGTGGYLAHPETVNPSYSGYCSIVSYPNPENSTIFSIGCPGCIDTTKYGSMEFYILLDNEADVQFMQIGLYTAGIQTSDQQQVFNYTQNTPRGWKKVVVDFSSATEAISDTVDIYSNQTDVGRFLIDDVILIPKSTVDTGLSKFVSQGFQSALVGSGGKYQLTIADSKSCPLVKTFEVVGPSLLSVAGTPTNPSVYDKANGKISVNATGGTPPYKYFWSHSATANESTASGLNAGTYTVTVEDAHGCQLNSTFDITNPAKSQTPMITGIGVGAGLGILGAAAITAFLVYRQRRIAVQTLINVEEGERRAYQIDFSTLELKDVIGAGSFGEVFRGEYKGTDVAVKKLKSQQMSKQQVDEFGREASVMVGLRHPNILLFMGVCLEPSRLCIVTELMPRGNLSEILSDEGIVLPVQIVFRMALDTLKGLQYIHSSGIIHRDLKSPNLLVDKNWNIKIADFGLSCARHNSNDEAQVSLLWTAPEILNREPDCYSFASDMYSFAIIMWELLSKQVPWSDVPPAAITSMVVGGMRPQIPSHWDTISTQLITKGWAQNPNARISVKDARNTIETSILSNISEDGAGASVYDNGDSFIVARTDSGPKQVQIPPPQPPFAVVAANVEGVSQLWEQNPRATCKAIEDMIKILRRQASKLGGYEISQDSPSLYGFPSANNALNFCLRTSMDLRDFEWDPAILACPNAAVEMSGSTILYKGLRVRMSIHWGAPTLKKDATTGKVSYTGSALNVATSMLSHVHGGAAVLCQEMYDRLMGTSATLEIDPFSVNQRDSADVNGKSMRLYEMVPQLLKDVLFKEQVDGAGSEEKEPWIVALEDIKIGNIIGTGTFGNVYSATLGEKKVAAKKFMFHRLTGSNLLEMRAECALLRGLRHENIIKFEGMCIQPPNNYLLTELMERGSLQKVLDDNNNELPWTLRLSFARDIAAGLAYLHKHDIIHRDVKSSNLLVSSNWSVKIADFGFSRMKDANHTMTQCGTVAWTAPEIFDGSHYTEKADVFSYAVVLWELIFRKRPWAGKHSMKIIQIMETGGRLPMNNLPPDVPQSIVNLVAACWEQVPSKRPSFEEVLQQLNSN